MGWNKFSFNWANATKVSTPSSSAIDYIQFIFNYGSDPNDEDFRLENLFVSEDVPLVLEYYSQNMVDNSGTKEQVFDGASDDDTALWTGQWDYVTETFIEAVMEIIGIETGELTDMSIAQARQRELAQSLTSRIPSRRRQPSLFMNVDQ